MQHFSFFFFCSDIYILYSNTEHSPLLAVAVIYLELKHMMQPMKYVVTCGTAPSYLVFLVYYVLTYITVEYALHDSSNGSSGAVTCHTRLLILLYSPQDSMTHEIKGTKRCTILFGQFTTWDTTWLCYCCCVHVCNLQLNARDKSLTETVADD